MVPNNPKTSVSSAPTTNNNAKKCHMGECHMLEEKRGAV